MRIIVAPKLQDVVTTRWASQWLPDFITIITPPPQTIFWIRIWYSMSINHQKNLLLQCVWTTGQFYCSPFQLLCLGLFEEHQQPWDQSSPGSDKTKLSVSESAWNYPDQAMLGSLSGTGQISIHNNASIGSSVYHCCQFQWCVENI